MVRATVKDKAGNIRVLLTDSYETLWHAVDTTQTVEVDAKVVQDDGQDDA